MSTDTRFLVKRNSDLTEGRGGMVTVGVYDDLLEAVEASKGLGVMGVGDGEVYVLITPKLHKVEDRFGRPLTTPTEEKVYGRRYDGSGTRAKWEEGYVYAHPAVIATGIRRPVEEDPEYQDYLRLQKKFEGK